MVLEGMVPVLMQTPPTHSRRSTTATRLPHFDAWMAALCPAGPVPSTIMSKVCIRLWGCCQYSGRNAPNALQSGYAFVSAHLRVTYRSWKESASDGGGVRKSFLAPTVVSSFCNGEMITLDSDRRVDEYGPSREFSQ